jgi:hypothetical protein
MITTFYILVLIRLHHIRRKHRSEVKERSHRKVTRVVLAVITAYFICWVPYWFLQIFITIDPLIHSLRLNFSILPANTNMRFLKELTHLTTIIGYANNCLNPVLYVFLSDSFREEYLLVLNCFNLNGSNYKNNLPSVNQQPYEEKEKEKQRKSVILRKRREIAMKKVKHSVAIDDMPSEYRSFSFRSHRPSEHKRFSSSSMPIPTIDNEKYELEHLGAFRQKSFNNKSNHSSTKRVTVLLATDPTHLSTSMIDDGGVYCGE